MSIRSISRTCAALLVLAIVVAAAPASAQQGRGGGGRAGGPPAPPAAPTPRWPDGKPMLGAVPGQPIGGWGAGVTTLPRGGKLDEIPFQPWARAAYDVRQIDQFEPHTRCKASGVSRQFSTPYGTEFVEVPDLQRLYIMDNGGPNSYRIVYLDGRSFPESLPLTNYGYSIGRWEGDTLVIDTVDFNGQEWLGWPGWITSPDKHVVERMRRDGNTLTWEATVEDPIFVKPWSPPAQRRELNPDPKAEIEEPLPCLEQDLENMATRERG